MNRIVAESVDKQHGPKPTLAREAQESAEREEREERGARERRERGLAHLATSDIHMCPHTAGSMRTHT